MAGLQLESMFHRRLLVLLGLTLLGMLLLSGQLARLTLASGGELLAQAERRLEELRRQAGEREECIREYRVGRRLFTTILESK